MRRGRRAAAGLILAAALSCLECSNAKTPRSGSTEHWTIVFQNEGWYREHAAPEKVFTGLLVRRSSPQGPGVRLGLTYALQTGTSELPIYAARVEPVFEGSVGQTITARGKLADSSDAGGSGQELWIGRFSISPPPPR